MSYNIEIVPKAQKEYFKLPKQIQEKTRNKILSGKTTLALTAPGD